MSEEVKRFVFRYHYRNDYLAVVGAEIQRDYPVPHDTELVLASAHDRVVVERDKTIADLRAELAPHLARDQRMSAAEAQRDLLLRENEELTKRLAESERIAATRNVAIGELGQRLAKAVESLKQWASECGECGGRGYTYGDDGVTGRGPDDREPTQYACGQCEDIRAAIKDASHDHQA